MDQEQAALAAVAPSPTSAPKRWPGASVWPSWDLLGAPKDPFSIEREARLHRQAAGECSRAVAVCEARGLFLDTELTFIHTVINSFGRGFDSVIKFQA